MAKQGPGKLALGSVPSVAQFLSHSNGSVPFLVILLHFLTRMGASAQSAPQGAVPPRPATPVTQPAKIVPPEGQAAPGLALVPAHAEAPASGLRIPANSPAMRLKVELEVGVPVKDFRVKNLLALEPGMVVESRWNYSDDLPLAAGRLQLAWTEFEVSDSQLATRLTRLA